jgi:hypothetical protein
VFIALTVISICLALVWFRGFWSGMSGDGPVGEESGPQAVIDNYGADIKKYAKEEGIAPEYLAALCLLESSGRKPAASRYEKHVYLRLKLVKSGLRNNYEHVTSENLEDAGDEALQNLASSWGPFQLMGYKCLIYDIKISDLRGDESIKWGVKWIVANYGKYLKRKEYKHAFHMHNAGRPFPASGKPKTHNPEYVNNGLKWMQYFKGKF